MFQLSEENLPKITQSVEEQTKQLTSELQNIFNEVKQKNGCANYVCGGTLPSSYGLPGLEILIEDDNHITTETTSENNKINDNKEQKQKYKPISLPIVTKEQANELIKICTKSLYGKGENTIFDETVRKSWELDPTKFKITNPSWNAMIRTLINTKIKENLGVSPNKVIEANLYKLLLYEEGGHFDLHLDSEKESGMFATLIIQLPSIYEGGEIKVLHNGKEQVFKQNINSSTIPYFLSFYSSCEHCVSVVQSGFRLCLVYNVVLSGSTNELSTNDIFNNTDLINRFLNLMKEWKEGCKEDTITTDNTNILINNKYPQHPLVYLLEHKYSTEGLTTIDGLKGNDYQIYAFLKRCVEESNNLLFEFYPSLFTKFEKEGFFDDDESDTVGSHFNCTKGIDPMNEGKSIELNARLRKIHIFPIEYVEKLELTKSSEYQTGNYGTVSSKWYKSACIIIFPISFENYCLMGSSFCFNKLNQMLLSYEDEKDKKYEDCVLFLKTMVTTFTKQFSNLFLSFVRAVLQLNNLELAIYLITNLTTLFGESVVGSILNLTKHFGIENLRESLQNLIYLVLTPKNYYSKTEYEPVCLLLSLLNDYNLTENVFNKIKEDNKVIDLQNLNELLTLLEKCDFPFQDRLINHVCHSILKCDYNSISVVMEIVLKMKFVKLKKYFLDHLFKISNVKQPSMWGEDKEVKILPFQMNCIIKLIRNLGLENVKELLEKSIENFVNNNLQQAVNEWCLLINKLTTATTVTTATIAVNSDNNNQGSSNNDLVNNYISEEEKEEISFITKTLLSTILKKLSTPPNNITLDKFIEFTKCLYSKQFISEFATVLQALQNDNNSFPVGTFIVPFLKTFIDSYQLQIIYSGLFNNLIAYCIQQVQTYVNRNEIVPQPPQWDFNIKLKCSCDICKEIQLFLSNSLEEKFQKRFYAKERRHIESILKKSTVDADYQELNDKQPHSIVITKIPRSEQAKQIEMVRTINLLQYLQQLSLIPTMVTNSVNNTTINTLNDSNAIINSNDTSQQPPKKKVKEE
ncbi:hypothetical protein ABK040_005376 [Willaertia magna]